MCDYPSAEAFTTSASDKIELHATHLVQMLLHLPGVKMERLIYSIYP